MTPSLPSDIRTCAPEMRGCSAPLLIIRPALISRSASLCTASINSGVGGVGWTGVTIYMKRTCKLPSGTSAGRTVEERAHLPGAFPARHVIEVELHEFLGQRHRLFLPAQFGDGVAADDFLGLDEGTIDDAELAVDDTDLGAERE